MDQGKIHLQLNGGEEYIGWAKARERALRALGLPFAEKKYLVDGADIDIRVAGEYSYIRIDGTAWVAYPFSLALQYSTVNSWPKLTFVSPMPEDPGPQPEYNPPPEQPLPPLTYVALANKFEPPLPPPSGSCSDGSAAIGSGVGSGVVLTYDPAQYQATIDAAVNALSGVERSFFNQVHPSNPEVLYGGYDGDLTKSWVNPHNVPGGGGCVTYYDQQQSWNGKHTNMDAGIAVAKAAAAVYEGNVAARSAYNAAYWEANSAWSAKYAVWLAAQNGVPPDPTVCYPHIAQANDVSRANRASQVSALYDEILTGGMSSLCVFNATLRPQYTPREWPTEPFFANGGVWTAAGQYAPANSSKATTTETDPSACNGWWPAVSYTNTYVDEYPHNHHLWASLQRAYGYSVTGTVFDEEHGSVAPNVTIKYAPSYTDWLRSARTKYDPDSLSEVPAHLVDFDLATGRGKLRAMFFEFYVYENGTWAWMPTPRLTSTVRSVSDCVTGYCSSVSLPTTTPTVPYENRVSAMRFLAAREYTYTKADDGSHVTWSPGIALSVGADDAAQFAVDLSSKPSFGEDLPDGVAVLYGVASWKLPATQDFTTGVTKSGMDQPTAANSPQEATSTQDMSAWITKKAIQVLTTASRS